MAKRYVDNIGEIILENADIVDFISRYLKLNKSGKNFRGLCPFHGEKTPSFFVSPDKQVYHCFGCNVSGNVITFVSEMENLGFIDTIEFIAENSNVNLENYLENNSEYSKEYHEQEEMMKLNREAAIFFYKNLSKSEEALKYLKLRGIDKNIVKTFGIGYALEGWNNLLDYLVEKGYKNELIQKAGLISKSEKTNNYYDKFRKRIMFPIFDIRGKVVAFGGRIIEKDEHAPKYLNSPETLVFHKSNVLYGLNIAKKNIRESNKLILVEGYMDVIMLNKFGINNVIAALGTAFTKEHAKQISKYVDEVIVCFDSDNAGIKATKRAIENMKKIVKKVNVIELMEGFDPDDFINKFGKDVFLDKIRYSKSSHLYLIDKLEEQYDFSDEYDLVEFMKKTKDVLADIEEYSRAYYYVEKISEKLDTPKEYIMKELFGEKLSSLNKTLNTNEKAVSNSKNTKRISSVLEKYEFKLLQFALEGKLSFEYIIRFLKPTEFLNKTVSEIMNQLVEYYNEYEKFELNSALEIMDVNDVKICEKLISKKIGNNGSKKEISIYIKNIEIEALNSKVKENQGKRISIINDSELEKLIIEEDFLKREIRAKKLELKNWKESDFND